MNKLTVVKIYDVEKYKPFAKEYGILEDLLPETAVINWSGNMGGICTNISHTDYGIVSPDYWTIINGEIIIKPNGGYVRTGLRITI